MVSPIAKSEVNEIFSFPNFDRINSTLILTQNKTIKITINGKSFKTECKTNDIVEQVLINNGIILDKDDYVNCNIYEMVSEKTEIIIKTKNKINEIISIMVPYETKYEESDTLYKGQEKIKQEGKAGNIINKVTYTNIGGNIDDEKVTEIKKIEPIDEIIVKGTKELGDFVQGEVYEITDEEREYVENVVTGECGGQVYDCQIAVAQSILDNCIRCNKRPIDVCKGCRYDGWSDTNTQSVKDAVSAVFDSGIRICEEPIYWFYAPKYCTSIWHESQNYLFTLGTMRFFNKG